jgi:shikimate dehydrogenase
MARISGTTQLAGLIGWPVAHSRSPRLYNHSLRRSRFDGAYVPLPAPPGAHSEAVHRPHAAGLLGCNAAQSHEERAAGACNTLAFGGRALHGSATDGPGFVASLEDADVDPAAGAVLLLGARGAARAVLLGGEQEAAVTEICA